MEYNTSGIRTKRVSEDKTYNYIYAGETLSLPHDKIGQAATFLQLQQPIEILAGKAAPWFGQVDGGTQYLLDSPIMQLIKEGVIEIIGG